MATKVVGLDIGTSMVRAAEVEMSTRSIERGGLGSLIRYGEAPLPRGAVVEGEVNDQKAVTDAIKRAWSNGGFSTKHVIVGFGNTRTLVREMLVSSMPMDQLRKSLPFQVEDSLPMHVDEALLDFYPTSEEDGQSGPVLRGILVAASKRSIGAMVTAAESAGLRVRGVDLRAFGLVRALVPGQWHQGVVALADIGARTTMIVIVDQGVPRLVRMLPNGGQDISDGLATTLQRTLPEAEEIKHRIGIASLGELGNDTAVEAVMTATKNVVDGIRNTIFYYAGNNQGAQFQQVVLAGGGAQLPGLGQYLAGACRLQVTYGNALGSLKASKSVAAKLAARESVIASSVGLAMGEVD